ncbi:MAG: ornithine cyclodeaminase family protein [Actinomycetes bacterium]|jgi:L-arginine dehydrogenase|uniref:Unannotated protein n=1 Tax=freshwater metagenome TaxID=449393 RepID=A0A6J6FX59_9ZZZZ|nr:ornithine cyclodeaminase family protein [Actinomycetota bacterium]
MTNLPILDEAEVLVALDRGRVLPALETAFAGLVNGRSVQPAQTVTVFPDGRGDCIFYPGALLDLGLIGVKVSPYLSDRSDAGLSPVTAYTLLLSASTGEPLLLCDSYALTTIRTAATTALAVQHLSRSDAKSLAVVGSGKVAREHLRFVVGLREWNDLRVYSPRAAGSPERQELVGRVVPEQSQLSFSPSARSAVEGADVVLLCTSSGSPVIERPWVAESALVTSISTNSPGAHEIEPASLGSYDVYCDYRATAPVTAGEMTIAVEAGEWSHDRIVADLAELATGFVPKEWTRPRFFRSTGLGIEDLAIAHLLVA